MNEAVEATRDDKRREMNVTRRGDQPVKIESGSTRHHSRGASRLARYVSSWRKRIRLAVLGATVFALGAVAGTSAVTFVSAALAGNTGRTGDAVSQQTPHMHSSLPALDSPSHCALKYTAVVDLTELEQRYGKSSRVYRHAFGNVAGQMNACGVGEHPLT